MTIGFVLGNGVSRKAVSPITLQQAGKVYGCNALYREFTPDVLVATDKPIATHIQESGYAKTNCFYTRRPLPGLGAIALPDKYRPYSSGPNALALAATDRHDSIYILGFDMGPIDGKFNNLYADTEFYKSSQHPPTFTGNWIKQMCEIITTFKDSQYFRVCGPTTAEIKEFQNINNLKHIDFVSFLNRINNQKDL